MKKKRGRPFTTGPTVQKYNITLPKELVPLADELARQRILSSLCAETVRRYAQSPPGASQPPSDPSAAEGETREG